MKTQHWVSRGSACLPRPQRKFKARLGYIAKPCFNNQKSYNIHSCLAREMAQFIKAPGIKPKINFRGPRRKQRELAPTGTQIILCEYLL